MKKKTSKKTGAIVTTGQALKLVQEIQKQIKAANTYTASIKVLGKVHTAEGDTVSDAIAHLNVPLGRGMSILSVSNGGYTQEKILPPRATSRLFCPSPFTRQIALKQTSLMFSL